MTATAAFVTAETGAVLSSSRARAATTARGAGAGAAFGDMG